MRKHPKWLFESPMVDDEDKARLAGLLRSVLLTFLIATIIYAIVVVVSIPQRISRFPLFVTIVLLELILNYLLRRGRVQFAGVLFLATLWIIITCMMVLAGGVGTPSYGLYILVILAAGLLFGGQGVFAVAGLSILSGIAAAYLESIDKLPVSKTPPTPFVGLSLQALGFLLAAFLLYRATRHTQEALDRSRRGEQSLEKANRAYRVLSGCNQAVVRATDEKALLQDVCQTIVDLGGYQQVWVGLIDPAAQADSRHTIQLAAQAGNNEHFLGNLQQVLDRHGDDDRPIDRVIATGEPKVVQDVQTDPACDLGRDILNKINCSSLIILPLKADNQTLGTLNVFSARAGDFTDEEVTLLTELAGDLAYGVMALRIRAEREQAEAALRDSERKFRTIFDEAMDVILVVNGETGEILSANRAAENVLGYAVDDLVGQSFMSLFFASAEATASSWIGQDTLPESQDLIMQFRRADGTPCPMDLTATLIHWADDFAVLAVLRDITEWQKMEEAERLRAELEKERELIELKENFVAVVSHQFRTPLTVVLSANELLENYFDRLPPEKRLKYIHQIKRQVNYMTSLLDDVLFMSRASRGKLEYRPGVLDLETFVQDELSKLEFVDNGAHKFVCEVSGKFDNLVLDEKLLQHILTNLLSNAIKYTPEGKEIRVELTKEDTTAVMRICDQGMGIPEHDQRRLFEPFHRAANVREISGTGLGLTIVKESVTMHGGTIEFESTEGSGTIFTVRLPYVRTMNGSSAHV